MGSGIATALILSNYSVILKEVNDKFLQGGLGRVKGKPQLCSLTKLSPDSYLFSFLLFCKIL